MDHGRLRWAILYFGNHPLMTNNEENWRMERAGDSCNRFYRSKSAPNKVTNKAKRCLIVLIVFNSQWHGDSVSRRSHNHCTVTPQWPMWLAQDHCSDSSLSPPLPIPPFTPMFRPHSCQVLSPSMFLSCNYPIVIVQAWKFWWNHRLQKYTLVVLIIALIFNFNLSFCYFSFTTLSIKKLFLREACASEISSGRDALIRSHLSGESHGKATSGFPRTGLLPQQRTRSQFWSCNCNSEQRQSRSWCKGC